MKKRRPWMRNWSPPLKRLLEKPVNFEGYYCITLFGSTFKHERIILLLIIEFS
jgi:hypothetical protein